MNIGTDYCPSLRAGSRRGARVRPSLSLNVPRRTATYRRPELPLALTLRGRGRTICGMFATTFLGHQGWVFQSERACLLVDPLLCEEFGQAHALTYQVYPPRVFTPEAFPRVDALMLTHEHDDHFDIPSLAKLDRRIPIFLSARSSTAAYKILCQMGFQVNPLLPGVAFECGDLQVLPLCGDHLNTNTGDEWDTLPFIVRQAEGAGSFFSMVDCTLTSGHIALARKFAPRPGIIGYSNNAQDWSHMIDCALEQTEGTTQFVHSLHQDLGVIGAMWGQPAALTLCAGGFSFYGARKWLNRRVFCVDPERVVKTLSGLLPRQLILSARPGQALHMEDHQVKRVEKQAPFLGTTAPNTWPIRDKAPRGQLPDYEPATGRRALTPAARAQLLERLTEFAGALVGGGLFKSLYSLLEIEGQGKRATFAFVLRQSPDSTDSDKDSGGSEPLIFVYNPAACSFDLTPVARPQDEFIAGLECWATDLLAVLSGEMGDIALLFGRAALWNTLPNRLNFDVFGELQRISGPLRRPAAYLRTYERILQGCASVTPSIRPRAG